MIIHNEEVREVLVEIPAGHKHLRTTIVLHDGTDFTFQEATIAAIARAYITAKTHPENGRVRLKGKRLAVRKEGFAEWQLVEDNS